jgi:hypothetical protein
VQSYPTAPYGGANCLLLNQEDPDMSGRMSRLQA